MLTPSTWACAVDASRHSPAAMPATSRLISKRALVSRTEDRRRNERPGQTGQEERNGRTWGARGAVGEVLHFEDRERLTVARGWSISTVEPCFRLSESPGRSVFGDGRVGRGRRRWRAYRGACHPGRPSVALRTSPESLPGALFARACPSVRRAIVTCVVIAASAGCAAPRTGPPAASPAAPSQPANRPGNGKDDAPAALPEIVFTLAPPESTLEAIGTSVLGRHEAWLERFEGTVTFVPAEIGRSHVEVDLDMTTLTMRLPALTRALRSKSFFDVERYPRARFVSTAITATDKPDVYRVSGVLDMHGHRKPVTFVATVVRGPGWATARGEVRLDRHDFGLVYEGPFDKLAEDLFIVKIWAQGTSR